MKYYVCFFETFEEEKLHIQKKLEQDKKLEQEKYEVCYIEDTIQEWLQKEFITECPACIISIRTQSIIPNEWFKCDYFKGVLSRSTGYDHIQKYNNICRGYLPCYCSSAVAEHATMLWMTLLKKLPQQIKQWKKFNRNNITCKEFGENKNMLVVGVGHIGYKVSQIAKALNINVVGVDIDKKHTDIKYIDETNIMNSIGGFDIIVCCMNLTEDNRDYFNYTLLSQVKKGAIFINVSRGELSNCEDLLRLLRENILGGVGMDVYPNETTLGDKLRNSENWFTDNKEEIAILKMYKLDNVIFTPHNAFNTEEGLYRKVNDTIEQIEYFYENGRFKWFI
tara:strand:- start:1172 stop:2179 length:1008 start_codon:yes stop_codon:yes gene_type:complete